MKKTNNFLLLAVLAGLVLVYLAVKYWRSPGRERTLPASLAKIDSSAVTAIQIKTFRHPEDVVLSRAGGRWELKSGDRTGRLEEGGGHMALNALLKLKPTQLVTVKPGKWGEFGVSDSTGTRVKVFQGSEVTADIWIGRSGFSQSNTGMFGGGYTHVRVEGDDAVYIVDGFLESQFSRGYNDWRDKSFVRLTRDSVDRVAFQYPDSSFVLSKVNRKWMIDREPADSAAVVTYLNDISYRNLREFAESNPAGPATGTVSFYKRQEELAKVEGWYNNGTWILRSNRQPETSFVMDTGDVILAGRKKFTTKVTK